jgi:Holliday junction DNA helicase RuvA
MISAVRGRVFAITPGEVQIETASGAIYRVLIPVSSYSKLKDEKEVLLYTVLRVKEDQMVLYGFLTVKEKAFFQKFISVSGIGGKIALSLISAFSTHELVEAINNADIGKISSIPGIGKKTAQRVVLELTGKLEMEEEQAGESVQLRENLVSGLVNLGYPAKVVKEVVDRTFKEHAGIDTFEELFKLALKKISKV